MTSRPAAKKHQDVPVKVKVAPRRRVAPTPVLPTAAAPTKTTTVTAPVSSKPKFHEQPIEQRKRMMWTIVAVGMFVIVVGWAFALGHELRQTGGDTSLFTRLTEVFRSFKLPDNDANSPAAEEIRQLEDQVFPQF